MNAPKNTILVRDGRVSISGKVTKAKLDFFQQDKKFVHLSMEEIRTLHSLGRFLAKMREGEFENQDTDPRPTERAIYECFAQQSILLETDLARAFLEMTGLAGAAQGNHVSDAEKEVLDSPGDLAPDDPLILGITKLMKQERWMSFERLCARINSAGITADPPTVCRFLKNRPISECVLVYPRDVNLLEAIAIVIWNTGE